MLHKLFSVSRYEVLKDDMKTWSLCPATDKVCSDVHGEMILIL